MPISRLSTTSCVGLEPRPLPSTGVTRLRRYYGPLRNPGRPSLSLAGVWLRSPEATFTAWVSRVALDLHVPTCRRHYPGGPLGSDRSRDGLFQPSPFIPSGSGLPLPFAGSASTLVVSRPARRSRVLRPVGSPSRHATRLSRRLRRFCYLPMNSPARYAVWGNCGEGGSGSSVGRHPQSPLAPSVANRCRRICFLSVIHGHRPVAHGDRLDPLTYCVGSGLSCKPMAAAFRFSDFKMLAFTLASYSSIDCVTYSWPYLSIR